MIQKYLRQTTAFIFVIPLLILFILSVGHPLYFDTIQFAGMHPTYYYTSNFASFFVPDDMDSGNPTFFGMYLALVWKLFGKSLIHAHLAMAPFIAILIYQCWALGQFFFKGRVVWAWLLSFAILYQCAIVSQSTLVSPDIIAVAAFLWGLNAVLRKQKIALTIAVILLSLISLRAMKYAVVLYLFSLTLKNEKYDRKRIHWWIYQLKPFLFGGLLGLIFLLTHLYIKGWIGYHPDSPWITSFAKATPKGVVINCIYLIWRLIDLGNIISVFSLIILSPIIIRKISSVQKNKSLPYLASLGYLVLIMFFITALPLCFYEKLLTHRYLIPMNSVIILLVIYFLSELRLKLAPFWALSIIIVQISGHFWTYSAKIDQGWDSTLSHWPYFELRAEFINFIEEEQIPFQDVGAGFILSVPFRYTDLSDSNDSFSNYRKVQTPYLLYTNANNDRWIQEQGLDSEYKILKYGQKGQVVMILYEKR